MELKQYQIVLVNMDPTTGNEIKRTRPCVIISPNEMNKYLQTIVVVPITSSSIPYPTRVEVKYNKTKSWVVLDQVTAIDRQRIEKILDHLSNKEIHSIQTVLKETYVD